MSAQLISSPSPCDAERALCAVHHKYEAFMAEAYLRQGLRDIRDVLGDAGSPLMQRVAMIIIKPEAVVGGRAVPIIEFLESHAFVPILFRRVQLTRNLINTIWRYQWNVATLDRLDLAESLYCAGEGVLVICRDDLFDNETPAPVRLRKLKGPAQPELRTPGHLRTAIAAPNRTMSMVHACDEPVDLIRETSILFERVDRRQLYSEIGAGYRGTKSSELLKAIQEMASLGEANDLSYESSLLRLRDLVAPASFNRLIEMIDPSGPKGRHWRPSWIEIEELVRTTAPALSVWDRMVIGATLIEHDEPGSVCTIDDDGVAHWAAGLGVILPLPNGI
ncbi:nucleoside-diphosphate kinase [Planosporangium flavigriseum]|uniref:Nucleoside diphosphate kinase-like domain-containing protein n=1 Tax=Planosporangium flavigriseum TaxID=373681 RepID=A0A8J3PMJ7_9ACTN|nr:nucleoside-diphosphate kinase [Planosporangium flavigriseum]NJC67394.1 nucleoside-diphosphate kinase [Planosporangium flavigriseum]GIG74972.1 hypothetical protein Pfl04_33760 [Planosporangium flavigriseum]